MSCYFVIYFINMVTKLLPNSPFSKTFDYYLKNPSQKVWITNHVSTFFVLVIALTFYHRIFKKIQRILNIRIIRKAQNIQKMPLTTNIAWLTLPSITARN